MYPIARPRAPPISQPLAPIQQRYIPGIYFGGPLGGHQNLEGVYVQHVQPLLRFQLFNSWPSGSFDPLAKLFHIIWGCCCTDLGLLVCCHQQSYTGHTFQKSEHKITDDTRSDSSGSSRSARRCSTACCLERCSCSRSVCSLSLLKLRP